MITISALLISIIALLSSYGARRGFRKAMTFIEYTAKGYRAPRGMRPYT